MRFPKTVASVISAVLIACFLHWLWAPQSARSNEPATPHTPLKQQRLAIADQMRANAAEDHWPSEKQSARSRTTVSYQTPKELTAPNLPVLMHQRQAAQLLTQRSWPRTLVPLHMQQVYLSAALTFDVDVRLLAAIGANESEHGRSSASGVHGGLNFAGCCAGPAQMCVVQSCGQTFYAYKQDGDGDGKFNVYNSWDAFASAASYIKTLKTIVGDNPAVLLAAYNAGPGNVEKYGGLPPFKETINYVSKGVDLMQMLDQSAA